MTQSDILKEFENLPPEAQKQVLDFIAFLKTRYSGMASKKARPKNRLADEAFIGIWRDRLDLQDSSAWVRKIRAAEWE